MLKLRNHSDTEKHLIPVQLTMVHKRNGWQNKLIQ